MAMYARCIKGCTVDAVNIRTQAGSKGRKSQAIEKGETLQLISEYTTENVFLHGAEVMVLLRNGYQLHVFPSHFEKVYQ